jgi:hypothetical protein
VHNPLGPKQTGDGRNCLTCDARQRCKYYMRWYRQELREGQFDEKVRPKLYENYTPRQCIFDPAIDIEDTYNAVIKYDGGATMSYSLNGSVPYEGLRLAINGTQGRIDYEEFHSPDQMPFPDPGPPTVRFIPMFGGQETIDLVNLDGGHGGGDPLLLDDIFIGPDPTAQVQRMAGIEDGIDAVLTGLAVHRSVNEQQVISVRQMRDRVFAAG